MKSLLATSALAAVLATHAFAESRELGAHEHGRGALNIAVEGDAVLMEFEAPGADIVGFEYAASTAEDRAAVDGAIAALAKPLELFTPPAAAGCVVTAANVALVTGEEDHHEHDEDHAEHGHDEHGHDGHGHDDEAHAKAEHGDHDHDGHGEEDHAEHAHEEEGHNHDEHAAEGDAGHTEFHAEYALTCADPAAITALDLGYFARFPNAERLDVQLISDQGAKGFDVGRDEPRLNLSGSI